jgi:hypothetical protein
MRLTIKAEGKGMGLHLVKNRAERNGGVLKGSMG